MQTNVIAEIAALKKMTVAELRGEWDRLYGEPTRSRNRDFLYRRLAWRIQELQQGGLSSNARNRIDELAPDSFVRARTPQPPQDASERLETTRKPRRDPRLPLPGTIITKAYKGRELHLLVLDDGFEWDGRHFRSLSAVARAVTGARWNGRLFFGLTHRTTKS